MKGTIQRGKLPILFDDIKEMLTYLEGDELQQARDKAILLIGFYGAMRRSEIANLEVDDLQFTRLGLLLTLRKSKTDQFDRGQMIAIPLVQDEEICAVRALKHWLKLSGISSGPVFRGFTRNHTIRKTKISDKPSPHRKALRRTHGHGPEGLWSSQLAARLCYVGGAAPGRRTANHETNSS